MKASGSGGQCRGCDVDSSLLWMLQCVSLHCFCRMKLVMLLCLTLPPLLKGESSSWTAAAAERGGVVGVEGDDDDGGSSFTSDMDSRFTTRREGEEGEGGAARVGAEAAAAAAAADEEAGAEAGGRDDEDACDAAAMGSSSVLIPLDFCSSSCNTFCAMASSSCLSCSSVLSGGSSLNLFGDLSCRKLARPVGHSELTKQRRHLGPTGRQTF